MSRTARRTAVPVLVVASFAVLGMRATVRAEARPVRTVLTIHLGPEDYPSNPVWDAGIREALMAAPEVPIDYFTEYLDADRLVPDRTASALAAYIRDKYQTRRIDLVIAMTDLSLQFVLNRRDELFPNAPIVFASPTLSDASVRNVGAGVTGVTVSNAYPETLNLALRLHPDTEQVFVIASSPNERVVESVRSSLQEFSRRARLTFVNEPTLPGLIARVKSVPARSLILYIWQAQTEPGNVVYPDKIARMVAEAATVPVYGTSDSYIGSGVVGGVMRRNRETGRHVGAMARQILDGARAQDIPIESARVVPVFDWRQLRRWNVDESRLPPGSDVQFRVPTVWETYRWYIVGTTIVVAAQMVLIAGLLRQRARRRRAEETIRASEATIRQSYERIRQLAGQLINAQEATRAGIARDLHDGVCQDLAALSIEIVMLRDSSGRVEDPETQLAIQTIEREMQQISEEIRRLSHDLHPATLRLLGLAAALRSHCREVEKRHGVEVSFKTEGDVVHLDQDLVLCLFRIGQETLRNGVIHGGARRFSVSLARSDDHVELMVTDDGCGFDVEAARRDRRGVGLVSMEERAGLFGGDVEIVSEPQRGTMIRFRAPAPAVWLADRSS
jgi:signal transduction histidine kinase